MCSHLEVHVEFLGVSRYVFTEYSTMGSYVRYIRDSKLLFQLDENLIYMYGYKYVVETAVAIPKCMLNFWGSPDVYSPGVMTM